MAVSDKSAVLQLRQAWINERQSPELLQYKAALVEHITDRLQQQVRFWR